MPAPVDPLHDTSRKYRGDRLITCLGTCWDEDLDICPHYPSAKACQRAAQIKARNRA